MSATVAEPQEHKEPTATELLEAKARELGLDVEELRRPEYPDFLEGKGYKLQIVEAVNTVSPKGAEQVELSLMALDENDEPVKYARSKMWVSYPFDSADFKFKRDSKQRAQEEIAALIRASGDPAFQSARKMQVGNRTRYFDQDDQELVGKARGHYEQLVFMRIMEEARRRQKEDPSRWIGTQFYAQRRHSEFNDTIWKSWTRISSEPRQDVPQYIFEPKQMLAPGGKEQHDEDESASPF